MPLRELHADAAQRVLDELGAEVRLGVTVAAVHSDPDEGPSVTIGGPGDGATVAADAVVVAVPHDAVADLMPPALVRTTGARWPISVRSPIVNVHLLYDRPVMTEAFLAGLDSPVQFVFDRTASSGAPPGHQCVAISLSAADEYLSLEARRARRHVHRRDRRACSPEPRRARVVSAMVTREVAATFRGAPGTAAQRPGPTTQLPGVFLAGAWTDTGWPATMEGAVRSGVAAAVRGRPAPRREAIDARRCAA